ncbi:tryptophanase [Tessaracoccus sp. OH4464_COT-324]|uniref:tryptophanase n=1 Tax=Tessaracoccus sp. OH4464_COT-324 TaxID=2491059 RepID=UPI000F62D938|nr:tryptophanase [Tessaracoccus sp. OH4464_COT-324]RRD46581.1 tryptophanase [Tessaracoccus sp. OH4464_COT-324]
MKYVAEPFKIKMVEPIRITSRAEREEALAAAHYNTFGLDADKVYIDLLTDSGTGAMSDAQWSAMLLGDEAYSGGKSYARLMDVVKGLFGYHYVQPVHQGRAAEKILLPLLIRKPGQLVVSNTFFDTTRAHVGLAGGRAVDCICPEGLDTASPADFKGNMDVERLKALIDEHGDDIAAVVMTVTNNTVGGQPVSLANLRETYEVAHAAGIPVVLDAARFAENAHFIRSREPGYADTSPTEIAREMFRFSDLFTMSAKKDGIVNMGGLVGAREAGAIVQQIKSRVIPMEGYLTYGGLAGRDLDALAVGLVEGLDENYLAYRVGQLEYLAARLDEHGIPYQRPVGGHAVFVDAGRLLPHIPWTQYPGQALAVELYLEAGIRSCDIGSYLMDRDPVTREEQRAPFEFTRLAVPRRVYTQAHLDVVAEALKTIQSRADEVRGLRIVWEPDVLRHFTSQLEFV